MSDDRKTRQARMDTKENLSRTGAKPEPLSGEAKGALGGDAGYITAEDVRRSAVAPSGARPAPSGTGAPEGTSGGNTGNVAYSPQPGPTTAASAETGATATHREQGVDAGRRLD